MSIKPWICNGSKTIVKDRWIDLHADDCALPDGTKISPFYVNDVPDFVVVVAVTVDGDFIFVRQYRHGTRQILLELPAGCMEPTDADPAAGAAKRAGISLQGRAKRGVYQQFRPLLSDHRL